MEGKAAMREVLVSSDYGSLHKKMEDTPGATIVFIADTAYARAICLEELREQFGSLASIDEIDPAINWRLFNFNVINDMERSPNSNTSKIFVTNGAMSGNAKRPSEIKGLHPWVVEVCSWMRFSP